MSLFYHVNNSCQAYKHSLFVILSIGVNDSYRELVHKKTKNNKFDKNEHDSFFHVLSLPQAFMIPFLWEPISLIQKQHTLDNFTTTFIHKQRIHLFLVHSLFRVDVIMTSIVFFLSFSFLND